MICFLQLYSFYCSRFSVSGIYNYQTKLFPVAKKERGVLLGGVCGDTNSFLDRRVSISLMVFNTGGLSCNRTLRLNDISPVHWETMNRQPSIRRIRKRWSHIFSSTFYEWIQHSIKQSNNQIIKRTTSFFLDSIPVCSPSSPPPALYRVINRFLIFHSPLLVFNSVLIFIHKKRWEKEGGEVGRRTDG